MGYLYKLEKERCFLGAEIADAYHSIDAISLSNGQVSIIVGVYLNRDAKYTHGLISEARLSPAYLPQPLDMEATPEPDVASSTAITYNPVRPSCNAMLGSYSLEIAATALFPTGIPYDLVEQKESLYPTVKRLLGMQDAVDVIEEIQGAGETQEIEEM